MESNNWRGQGELNSEGVVAEMKSVKELFADKEFLEFSRAQQNHIILTLAKAGKIKPSTERTEINPIKPAAIVKKALWGGLVKGATGYEPYRDIAIPESVKAEYEKARAISALGGEIAGYSSGAKLVSIPLKAAKILRSAKLLPSIARGAIEVGGGQVASNIGRNVVGGITQGTKPVENVSEGVGLSAAFGAGFPVAVGIGSKIVRGVKGVIAPKPPSGKERVVVQEELPPYTMSDKELGEKSDDMDKIFEMATSKGKFPKAVDGELNLSGQPPPTPKRDILPPPSIRYTTLPKLPIAIREEIASLEKELAGANGETSVAITKLEEAVARTGPLLEKRDLGQLFGDRYLGPFISDVAKKQYKADLLAERIDELRSSPWPSTPPKVGI